MIELPASADAVLVRAALSARLVDRAKESPQAAAACGASRATGFGVATAKAASRLSLIVPAFRTASHDVCPHRPSARSCSGGPSSAPALP